MDRRAILTFTFLALLAGLFVAIRIGIGNWDRITTRTRESMAAALRPLPAADPSVTLPTPVQRYLDLAAPPDRAPIRTALIRHEGEVRMSEEADSWRRFTSTQFVTTYPPAFDWDARIRMAPGLSVHVRDGYLFGRGGLRAAILGLWVVANASGELLAESQLLRYLAETPWYPTALRPTHGVKWQPLTDSSARATLREGAVTAALDFHFSPDGLVSGIFAAARPREVNGEFVPTSWSGRFSNYQLRHGLRIPLEGEVEWTLPSGPQPYWRGRIIDVTFE
jgi:hypothetical protein